MHFDLISSRVQSVFQPYFGQVQGSLRAHFLLKKRLFTYKHTGLLGLCSTRGRGGGGGGWCVFHSLTRRSVNLDYSNFGQDVLWEKMNILRQKIRIKLMMASL